MTFITLAAIISVFFIFPSTRKYGVIGTGLLLYIEPVYTVGVLLIAVGAFYEFYRRKSNAH